MRQANAAFAVVIVGSEGAGPSEIGLWYFDQRLGEGARVIGRESDYSDPKGHEFVLYPYRRGPGRDPRPMSFQGAGSGDRPPGIAPPNRWSRCISTKIVDGLQMASSTRRSFSERSNASTVNSMSCSR